MGTERPVSEPARGEFPRRDNGSALHGGRGRHEPFLFHPLVIEFYEGLSAVEQWVADFDPMAVGGGLEGDRPGKLLDCVRPVRVE